MIHRVCLALLLKGAAASEKIEFERKGSIESFKSFSPSLNELNESFRSEASASENGSDSGYVTPRETNEENEKTKLFSTPPKKTTDHEWNVPNQANWIQRDTTEDTPVFKKIEPAKWIQGPDPTTNSEHEKIMKGLKQQIKEFEELVNSTKSEETKKIALLQEKIGVQFKNQFQDTTTIKTIEECAKYKTLRSEYKRLCEELCDKLELRKLVKELETLVEDQLTFDDPFYFRKSNQEFFGEKWAKMLDRMNEKDRKAIKQKAENILDTKKLDIQRIGELLNKWRVRFKSKWTEITKTSVTAQEFKEFKELNKKYNDLCTRLDKDTKL